jgi:Mg-chelatase subunit ChlD
MGAVMETTNKLVLSLLIFLIFSVSAVALDVNIITENLQSSVGDTVVISVQLMNNSTPVNNTLVNFTSTLGSLVPSSVLTNVSGMAAATINSTVSGVGTINVSSGASYNTTNVSFAALPADSIMVVSNAQSNIAGNITNVSFTLVDQFNNVNSTDDINFTISIVDVFGNNIHDIEFNSSSSNLVSIFANSIFYSTNDSSVISQNVTLSINSTVAGSLVIYSDFGSINNSTSIIISPAALQKTRTRYNDAYIVNTSSAITVSAYDKFENPINNTNISITVTSPNDTAYNSPITYNSAYIVDPNGITSLDGSFATQFVTDKRAGDNIVHISADNGTILQNITIEGIADEVGALHLSYSPSLVLANNADDYELTASPVDQFQNPKIPQVFPIKEQVLFSLGSTVIIVPLNDYGQARTTVGPTPYIEDVSVLATYREGAVTTNFTNTSHLYFVGGNLTRIDMYAVPSAVLQANLNGNHESSVSLVALDEWGHTLPNVDILINNTNTTLGNLTIQGESGINYINATTDANGRIYGAFTSNNVSGNVTFTALSGSVNASTSVEVKKDPFMSVILSVSPPTVDTGGIINVTTIISVEGELPITRETASAMLVLDRSGSMDPDYYAGVPLDVVTVIDRSGSMSGQPIIDARNAAKSFKNNLASNAQVGVVSYSDSSRVDIGLTLLNTSDNKASIDTAIDGISDGGWTAMGDGMADANSLLTNGRAQSRKVMIVLTDGQTNSGGDQDGDNAVAIANANGITIYTIGLGTNLDESLLQSIASAAGGKYYNAPTGADLQNIYASIAQEISDYDVSEVEYGVDGFTEYDHNFQGSLSGSTPYETTFVINESINDLKVQLDWTDSALDVDLQLTSPSGIIYGKGNDTTGYNFASGSSSEYIWIHPLAYTYPDTDNDVVESGTWNLKVSKSDVSTEPFSVSTYIDKKSATIISSHAFMTSFDETKGDRAGLVLYSYDAINSTSEQTSYVYDNSSWVGYFTAESDAFYNFNVSWADSSSLNVKLYEGVNLLSSSSGTGFATVTGSLSDGGTYFIEVSKGSGSGTDTQFSIDVSSSILQSVMMAYYDSNGGGSTPRYRKWSGLDWSTEKSASFMGASPYYVVLESNPNNREMILGTSDYLNDVNLQVWDGSTWGLADQVTSNLDSYSRRGFDIAYEQVSGDALAVFMDMNINDGVARYQIWDGISWSTEAATNASSPGVGDIGWIELASNPNSDEIILVTGDDERDIRAQVWDGSSWGNSVVITNDARATSYKCFDVVYEEGTGRAMVVWSDMGGNDVKYRIWNGSAWGAADDIPSQGTSVYWLQMAADPNGIIMVSQDYVESGWWWVSVDSHVYANTWDGNSWSSQQLIEGDTGTSSTRAVDVAYEASSGDGIVVWGDNGQVPKYKVWDGSSWSSELSASNIGASPRWVQLTPNPLSDEIFMMTVDSSSDINVQNWNGSAWGEALEVESSATSYYECFDIAISSQVSSTSTTAVSWSEWTADIVSTLDNDSLTHLENAIDTFTADGLTAIDEGMFSANNGLSSVTGNSTIVLMTDGLDNSGYHSLLEEAQRAKANNTVVYTVGFGTNESEVDPVLAEIASITGGEYYFAPNSSVLKSIFTGIAEQLTNFSAQGPLLTVNVPYNYITPLAAAKVTYVAESANTTMGNATSFVVPYGVSVNATNPDVVLASPKSSLSWQLPSMGPGDKWGLWYQLKVEGAGYVPVIMPDSSVTYTDLDGQNITIYIPTSGGAAVGGGMASVLSYGLGELTMVPENRLVKIDDDTEVKLTLNDITGNSSFGYVLVYSSLGYFNNYENPVNVSVVGSNTANFTSAISGNAHITAYAYNINNASDILMASDMIIVRPNGLITIS